MNLGQQIRIFGIIIQEHYDKGGPVEEWLHKKTSQYSKFEFFLPKTES